MRLVLLLLLSTLLLVGDTFRLYLKDGSYHVIREYTVEGDRIRYFSTERGEWEEIPKELVDVDKTEREHNSKEQEAAKETREQNEEDQAEREFHREIASIPEDPGAYYRVGDQIKTVQAADYQIITSKKRKTLQVLSPVPIVPGKASVVIQGDHSKFTVDESRPNFYLRLEKQERFGIISLSPKKNVRLVENISMMPVTKQNIEDRKQMDAFQQQLGDGLYKVWPEKPLTPGEYALVEFSEDQGDGEINLLLWDFAYKPGQAQR